MKFSGELIYWRGPSPFYFVATTDDVSAAIHDVASLVTYGWGVIPVSARVGKTTWTTSLFPKEGRYLVPVKAAVREVETLELGQEVVISLEIDLGRTTT